MEKQILRCLLVLMVVVSLLMSCGEKEAGWKGTITTEDGITVIKNPKEPVYARPVLSLERNLVIGEMAGLQKEATFSELSFLDVDRDDSIYILSFKDSAVFVFDSNGRFLRRFGQPGKGPGELDRPMMISLSGEEILVLESGRRLSLFNRNGEFLRALSAKEYWVLVAALDSRKNIYTTTGVIDPTSPFYRLIRFDAEMSSPAEISKCPAPNALKGFDPFMPVSRWQIDPADNVIYSRPADYVLEYYNPEGYLFKKVTKAFEPVKITEEEKEEQRKEMAEVGIVKFAFSEYRPAFNRFYCDDSGRLYVQTFEKDNSGNYLYDVFDPEGRFITRISFKGQLLKVARNRIYCREEDEEGYENLVRYQLIWKLD